jgi:predicted ATPase
MVVRPFYRCRLAEAFAKLGRPREALDAAEGGLAFVERTGQRESEADLYRVQGEILWRSDRNAGEAALSKAVTVARDQGARSFELRAATTLARLWAEQGERQKARDFLAPIYGWFTDGCATPDLIQARELMDEFADQRISVETCR